MVRIEILSGPEAGRTIELGAGRHVVGRAPGNEVRLASDAVSSRHLELEVAADGLVRFRDLGSTNGTFSGGVRVQEGEWFAGSELKLGSIRLRLLEPASSAAAAPVAGAAAAGSEENAAHRRALEQAMAGKGGGFQLVLAGLLVAAAGAAYWFFFHGRGGEPDQPGATAAAAAAATGPAVDGIEDRGRFRADDAGAWVLSGGLRLAEERLHGAVPRGRAQLSPRFPVPAAALSIAAHSNGDWQVWAEIEWGRAESEAAEGLLVSAALGAGPVVLPLPPQAAWFRLALRTAGSGSLQALTVNGAEAAPLPSTAHEGYTLEQAGGNLRLLSRDGTWSLRAGGPGGTWTPVAGGVDFAGEQGAWLSWAVSPATLAEGPFLLLSDGGPVAFAPGVAADACPGLLLGGGARRLLVRFEPPARVEAQPEGLLVHAAAAHLRWDLSQGFAEASRLNREIDDAERRGDSAAVLALSAQLLRDWPLQEADLERASNARRAVLTQGRQRLEELDVAVGEALFLGSSSGMASLQQSLRQLAAGLPGTDLAREAEAAADLLARRAQEAGREEAAAAAAYRTRLAGALERTYPLLAAWVRQQEGNS